MKYSSTSFRRGDINRFTSAWYVNGICFLLLSDKYLSLKFLHPDGGDLYTRMENPCTPGWSRLVHPGGALAEILANEERQKGIFVI